MGRSCTAVLVCLVCTAALAQAPALPTGPRTWTDTSGTFKIEAEFVSLAAGIVQLKKADGSVINVPIGKLSPADQKIARQLYGAAKLVKPMPVDPMQPMVGGPVRPLPMPLPMPGPQPRPMAGPDPVRLAPMPMAADPPRVIPTGTKPASKQLAAGPLLPAAQDFAPPPAMSPPVAFKPAPQVTKLEGTPVKWRVTPHANTLSIPVSKPSIPLFGKVSPDPAKTFENSLSMPGGFGVFFPSNRVEAWIRRKVEIATYLEGKAKNYAERVDLAAGKSLGIYPMPADTMFAGVSMHARRIAAGKCPDLPHGEHDYKERLDIFELDERAQLKHVVSFDPFGDLMENPNRLITDLWWLDDGRILVMNLNCRLRLCDVDEKAILYDLTGIMQRPVLDQRVGHFIARLTNNEVVVVDSLSGETVGNLPKCNEHILGGAFSWDGKEAVIFGGKVCDRYDLATGNKLDGFAFPKSVSFNTAAAWVEPRYIVNGYWLIDRVLGDVVWEYRSRSMAFPRFHGGHGWFVEGEAFPTRNARLIAADFPTPPERKTLEALTPERLAAALTVKGNYGHMVVGLTMFQDVATAAKEPLAASPVVGPSTVGPPDVAGDPRPMPMKPVPPPVFPNDPARPAPMNPPSATPANPRPAPMNPPSATPANPRPAPMNPVGLVPVPKPMPAPMPIASPMVAPSGPVRQATLFVANNDDQRPIEVFVNGQKLNVGGGKFNKHGMKFELSIKEGDMIVARTSDRGNAEIAFALVSKEGQVLSYSKVGMPIQPDKAGWKDFATGKPGDSVPSKVGFQGLAAQQVRGEKGVPQSLPADFSAVWFEKTNEPAGAVRIYPGP